MPRRLVSVVACALIDPDGRVLIAQRSAEKPMGGLWEFPGGKIEAGEIPEETLIRELREELSIAVQEACLAPFTFASHAYPDFHLLMPLYLCRRWEGTPQPLEHSSLKWVRPERSEPVSHAGGRFAAHPDAARSALKRFARDTTGATAIEYAVIASMISILIVGGASSIGTQIKHFFEETIVPNL